MNIHHVFEDNEAIDNWLQDSTVRYAARHGGGYNKTLEVNLQGVWIVTDHRTELYRGERSKAIQIYNDINPKNNQS